MRSAVHRMRSYEWKGYAFSLYYVVVFLLSLFGSSVTILYFIDMGTVFFGSCYLDCYVGSLQFSLSSCCEWKNISASVQC